MLSISLSFPNWILVALRANRARYSSVKRKRLAPTAEHQHALPNSHPYNHPKDTISKGF